MPAAGPPTLLNGGFEDFSGSIFPWTTVDVTTLSSVTSGIDTSVVHSALRSLKIVNTAAGEDDFVRQQGLNENPSLFSVTGVIYTISGWVNCTSFTAAAILNRGLAMIVDGAIGSSDITGVTSGWEYRTVSRPVATTNGQIAIRLYAPQGTIYYDDLWLTSNVPSFIPRRMPIAA